MNWFKFTDEMVCTGDRTGRLHIAHNQLVTVPPGPLPCHGSIYRGGMAEFEGEVRVIGVTLRVEGVLQSVENITIVDYGMYFWRIRKFYINL